MTPHSIHNLPLACTPATQELSTPVGMVAYPSHNYKDGAWRTEGLVPYGPGEKEALCKTDS